MTDESNREQWLSQIKQSVETKVEDQLCEDSWTDFVKDVAWWLHSEKQRKDVKTIEEVAGLMKYGVTEEEDLKQVAGSPPNRKDFREALESKGVTPIICDMLFNKYIPQQQPQQEDYGTKPFDIEHLTSITPKKCRWVDHSHNLPFTGRTEFFNAVKNKLDIVTPPTTPDQGGGENDDDIDIDENINLAPPTELTRAETAPISNGPSDIKESFSIVYSSVSGSGKTVAMLQLKQRLPIETKPGSPIVVSYLGFNSGLELTDAELLWIEGRQAVGAKEVLARRLVASTIISHHNSSVTASLLPSADDVYDSRVIPSVNESQELLLKYMDNQNMDSISIVAGVDEVQLLNRSSKYKPEEIGLGRFFLRTLRRWQVNWNRGDKEGKGKVYLLPVGTGIELEWSEDQSTGLNTRINGSDAILISKSDFKDLTKELVSGLGSDEFHARFENATEETVVENVSAMYWPRVRLLQWFDEQKTNKINEQERCDANHEVWNEWLSKWMLCEPVDLESEGRLAPGKGSPGKIRALFQLSQDRKVFIIPDGFAAPSILDNLAKVLPMCSVYDCLQSRFQSLSPNSLVVGDEYAFEDMGFDVVTLAIHVGLYTIYSKRKEKSISLMSASDTQKLRLGLALWFADHGALPDANLNEEFPGPIVLGQGTISETTNFYPFKDKNQKEFRDDVKEMFRRSAEGAKPLYIRGGKNACCDYLYFFLKRTASLQGQVEWICTIGDAKHTSTNDPNISGDDQKKLYVAAIKVNDAISNMNYTIQDIRLMFVTNKRGKADSEIEGLIELKKAVENLWPDNAELELLNEKTFDCGPFSDVLSARRHHGQKRKREPNASDL